jgi:hypothetical protein
MSEVHIPSRHVLIPIALRGLKERTAKLLHPFPRGVVGAFEGEQRV